MKIQRTTYFSIGSNLGDRLKNLQNAVDRIHKRIGSIQKISSVYKSPALGFDGNEFFNICIQVTTTLNLETVMKTLLDIEKNLGRLPRGSSTYVNRVIDIDILLFDDEVIFSKQLVVPHPRMLERKFVLIPLEEIAKHIIHPITKTQISTCLQQTTDTSVVETLSEIIKRPVPISEKYNYIAIEGNIGAGKTSLANLISDHYNARLVLERFADNPFLPKFYKDRERYAFPLEMSFLADRYQQLSDDLGQYDLFKNFVISDYYIFKSLIFAQITLPSDEYALYRKIFDIIYKDAVIPDLYVYLYQSTAQLLVNIKNRGREYEQSITSEYLQKIHNGYINFIKTEPSLNSLIIDVTKIDFVNREEDYNNIIEKIENF